MKRSDKFERIREAIQHKTRPATNMKITIQNNPNDQGSFYAKVPWDIDIECNVPDAASAEMLKDFLTAPATKV